MTNQPKPTQEQREAAHSFCDDWVESFRSEATNALAEWVATRERKAEVRGRIDGLKQVDHILAERIGLSHLGAARGAVAEVLSAARRALEGDEPAPTDSSRMCVNHPGRECLGAPTFGRCVFTCAIDNSEPCLHDWKETARRGASFSRQCGNCGLGETWTAAKPTGGTP